LALATTLLVRIRAGKLYRRKGHSSYTDLGDVHRHSHTNGRQQSIKAIEKSQNMSNDPRKKDLSAYFFYSEI